MLYRSKQSPEDKIQILTDYMSSKLSMIQATQLAGV